MPIYYTYRCLYIIVRSEAREYEDLVAEFLDFDEDPQVAALALSGLCTHWQLGVRYRDYIQRYLRGVSWDIFDEVRMAAISASGEYLRSRRDCSMLRNLLANTEAGDSDIARFAVEAVARALGEPHKRAVPPSRAESDDWVNLIVSRGKQRVLSECEDGG